MASFGLPDYDTSAYDAAIAQARAEYEANRSRTWGEALGDTAVQALQGATGLGKVVYGLGNMATLGLLDRGLGFSENFQQTDAITNNWKSAPLRRDLAKAQAAFDNQGVMAGLGEYITSPSLLMDAVVPTLPQLLPGMWAARATSAAAAGANIAENVAARMATNRVMATVGAQSAGSTNVDATNLIRDSGGSAAQQQWGGVGAGLISGIATPAISKFTGAAGLEANVARRLMGLAAPAGSGSLVGSVASGAAREGVEEYLQSGAEQMATNAFAPGVDLMDKVGQQSAMGGMLGGMLGATFGAANYRPVVKPTADESAIADVSASVAQDLGLQGVGVSDTGRTFAQVLSEKRGQLVSPADAEAQLELLRRAMGGQLPVADNTGWTGTGETVNAPDTSAAAWEQYAQDEVANQWVSELEAKEAAWNNELNLPTAAPVGTQGSLFGMPRYPVPDGVLTDAYGNMVSPEPALGAVDSGVATEQLTLGDALASARQADFTEAQQPAALPLQQFLDRTLVPPSRTNPLYEESLTAQDRARQYAEALQQPDLSVQQVVERQTATPATGITESDLNTATQAAENAILDKLFYESNGTYWSRAEMDGGNFDARDYSREEALKEAGVDTWASMLGISGGKTSDGNRVSSRSQKMLTELTAKAPDGVLPGTPEAANYINDYLSQHEAETDQFHRLLQNWSQSHAAANPTTPAAPTADAAAGAATAAVNPTTPVAPAADAATSVATTAAANPTTPTAPTADATTGNVVEPTTNPAANVAPAASTAVEPTDGVVPAVDRASPEVRSAPENSNTGNSRVSAADVLTQLNDMRLSPKTAKSDDTVELHRKVTSFIDSAPNPDEVRAVLADMASDTKAKVINGTNVVSPRHPYLMRKLEDYLQRVELNNPPGTGVVSTDSRNSLVSAGVTPLDPNTTASLVAKANQMLGKDAGAVTLFTSVDEARAALPHLNIPDNARGIYHDGNVFVVGSNIASTRDLAEVISHERAHNGFASLLGDKLAPVTNRLMANPVLRKRIQEKMRSEGLSRAVAGEEVLAEMVSRGERLNDSVLSKIRSAIRTAEAKVLGLSDYVVSDAHVQELMDAAASYRRGDVFNGAITDAQRFAVLDKLLGAPTPSDNVRLSKVADDLNRSLLAATTDSSPANMPETVSRFVVDQAKNLKAAVGVGSLFRASRQFMTLKDQYLADGHLFDYDDGGTKRNSFEELVRSIDDKQNDQNKLLMGDATGVYRSVDYDRALATALQSATTKEQAAAARAAVDAQFQRTVKSQDVSQRWVNLKAKDRKLTDIVAQYGTYYQLHPDRDIADQSAYQTNNAFTEQERLEALPKLQAAWRQMTPEAKKVYMDAQADMGRLWNARYAALQERMRSMPAGKDKDNLASMLAVAMHRISNGPYSPLQRYGNYLVTARNKDGSLAWFSGYDTKAEADSAAKALNANLPDGQTVTSSLRGNFNYNLDGINQKTIDTLLSSLDGIVGVEDEARGKIKDALLDVYLSSLPNHSFMQHANQRKNVGGFSMDSMRAYNDYISKASRTIASLRHDANISDAMARMENFATEAAKLGGSTERLNAVVNAVKDQRAAAEGATHTALTDKLTAASFLHFLSSPSQMFMNGMQTPLVAIPRLAAQFNSWGGVLRSTKEALDTFVRSGGDFLGAKSKVAADSPMGKALRILSERGKFDTTQAHEVAALGQGYGTTLHGHWRSMMNAASWAMHKSEVFNRQVTAYITVQMALREAKGKGLTGDAAVNYAADAAYKAIDESHLDYSQQNAPAVMQGPWWRLTLQFQKYRFGMLAMMSRDLKNAFGNQASPAEKATARRALTYMLGTQAMLLGAAGTAVAPIVFALLDAFRDDDDLTDARTDFLSAVPQIVSHGVLGGVLGVDPSRMDAGSVLPYFGDRQYIDRDLDAAEATKEYLLKYMGPFAGLTKDLSTGVSGVMSGDGKNAAALLPKGLRDVYLAFHNSDGMRTKDGAVTYEPDMFDTLLGAAGIVTSDIRAAKEKQAAGYAAQAHVSSVRQRYLAQFAYGTMTDDTDLVQGVMEKVQSWNEAHPDLPIRRSDLMRAYTKARTKEKNVSTYGVISAKKLSQSVLDATQ